jgi:hypothetical protein
MTVIVGTKKASSHEADQAVFEEYVLQLSLLDELLVGPPDAEEVT